MSVFLFGTRLTNISRELKRRDIDEAMAKVSSAVKDWSGGTRIGTSLKEFNYKWARRVLTQGAHVLIMTDGLDREDSGLLEHEMQRLRRRRGASSGSIRCSASTASAHSPAASAP